MATALAPTVPLIHGSAMPVLGFGTSPLQGAEAATAVRTAIETGYRLIDTAEFKSSQHVQESPWPPHSHQPFR